MLQVQGMTAQLGGLVDKLNASLWMRDEEEADEIEE